MVENKNKLQKNTFKSFERLKSKKEISLLFDKGNDFLSEPFKVIWNFTNNENKSPAKIAISVPKKNYKKAVDRNYIKRQIREGYRKNKHALYSYLTQNNLKINIIIIFLNRKIIKTKEIEQSIIKLLNNLIKNIENSKTEIWKK